MLLLNRLFRKTKVEKFYLETKIIATTLSDCRVLIKEMDNHGFEHDGIIHEDGVLYWAFVKINYLL